MQALRRVASSERLDGITLKPTLTANRQGVQLRIRGSQIRIKLPNELWGAASLALKLCANKNGEQLSRARTIITQALAVPISSAPDYPIDLAEALEFTPTLSQTESAASLFLSAAFCVLTYIITAPARFNPLYSAGMALLCMLSLTISRMWLLERHYKAIERPGKELATKDSRFHSVDGAVLHYKRAAPTASVAGGEQINPSGPSLHCLHGFGASAFSWSFVQRDLAHRLGGIVTAHDMPGFGLSQRPPGKHFYSLAYNGTAACAILDVEGGTSKQSGADTTSYTKEGGRGKRILIGHSMGGAAAAEGVIQNPQDIAALILVAPAIVALWTRIPDAARGDPVAAGAAVVEELVSAQDPPGVLESQNSLSSATSSDLSDSSGSGFDTTTNNSAKNNNNSRKNKKKKGGVSPVRVAAAVIKAIISEILHISLLAATPLLTLILRKFVRSRQFWERGLASAWVDKSKISARYVDGYRFPQLVRGWESGMIRFLRGRFSEKAGIGHAIAAALQPDGHLSQAERLAATCREHGIPILLVHGTQDALVPVQNSRRLAKVLPGAQLVEFERCGHMPHEEFSARFVDEVVAFVKGL